MKQKNPLRMLNWEQQRESIEKQAQEATLKKPNKGLKSLPNMQGITPPTQRFLKWKSLKYMIQHDKNFQILFHFFKHPFRYTLAYIKSLTQKSSHHREGDFFFYGLKNRSDFSETLKKDQALLVVGFSYCHKPFECPSGRFTDQCIQDENNPACQQCFIYKVQQLLPPNKVIPLIIPTIHYVGDAIFTLTHKYPKKELLFLITACEMTLEMFGDWGNMVQAKGIGVRLDGRICNTMKAFELSEKGIKPGLTVVLPETQEKILQLIKEIYHRYTPPQKKDRESSILGV